MIAGGEETLKGGDAESIGEMISAMMLGFQRNAAERDAKKTVALYVSQLQVFPNWAVKRACEDALRNGGDFSPTVPSMVKRCQSATLEMRADLVRMRRLLNADVYREPTPEERAVIAKRFKTILSETIDPPSAA